MFNIRYVKRKEEKPAKGKKAKEIKVLQVATKYTAKGKLDWTDVPEETEE